MSGMNYLSLSSLIFFLSAAFSFHVAAESLPIVKCNEPIAATVAVDAPRHRFIPYYVTLHRCQGSWKHFSPNTKQCVATFKIEIKIEAFSTVTNKFEDVIVYNHTSCGTECNASPSKCNFLVQKWNEETCECECLFNDSPPPEHVMPRKDGFRWNKERCRYECSRRNTACSHKKKWNEEECSCVCNRFYKYICDSTNKQMNPDTCECTKITDRPVHDPKRKGFFSYVAAPALVVCLVLAVLIVLLCGILNYRLKTTPQSMRPAISKETETSSVTIATASDCPSPVLANYESGV